jgi:transposase
MIPAVIEKCAGIDVGKKLIWVTVMVGPAEQEPEVETHVYGTTTSSLLQVKQWLGEKGVTSVAMESTGSYWIPIHNILCESVQVVLGCSHQIKPLKGNKTDRKDSEWLAHLHRHGLIRGSFIPPKQQWRLRDFTRRRKKLLGNLNSEKNRVQKTLEVANVKIGNVVSNVFGISGQGILQALLKNQRLEEEEIAQLAKAKLKSKVGELVEALQDHSLDEHHRWMIQQSVDHRVFLAQQVQQLEAKIREAIQPWHKEYELLQTIPGVKEETAAVVLAEAGPDMSVFPTPPQLTSWAGACPANNQTGGKAKRAGRRKGNRFLMSAMTQAAWGASRTKGSGV